MVMHEVYTAARKTWPGWRGWLTVFFVAVLILPLAAFSANPAQALFVIAVTCALPAGFLVGLCVGAKRLLQAWFGIQEPFNFLTVAALLAAVALACAGLFAIPAYMQPFASFGANLPEPALFLLEYRYLLLLPALLLPPMVYMLRNQPRRETYFTYVLAGEFFVLMLCVLLYVQLFKIAEPVAG